MSHISKQTIEAVAAKQEAMSAQQREALKAQMQESFDMAQSVAATRLRFAELVAKEFMADDKWIASTDVLDAAGSIFNWADALAQEHHRRATAERLAWFASKGIEPSMTVLDAAKRHGIEVPRAEAPKPLVVVD